MVIQTIGTLFLLVLVIGTILSQNPWEPSPKDKKWWMKRHRQNLNTTASLGKDINIVFIGSSSIDYWSTTGKEIWDNKYAPLGAVNYGIRGDRTEHLLWRVENGELDGLSPKLVVIYIGCNKVPRVPDDECVRGINETINRIHQKLPNCNLLYIALFPRGDKFPIKDMLTRIRNITNTLKPMLEGDTKRRTHFLDLFFSLAPTTLDKIYEEYYSEDKLHQNLLGYQQWDNLMNKTFYSLIQ